MFGAPGKDSPSKTEAKGNAGTIPCARAGILLERGEKRIRNRLVRLRNGIRDLKETRGAFTPGGKRRLYRLERKKVELDKLLARITSSRKRLGIIRRRAKLGACRFPAGPELDAGSIAEKANSKKPAGKTIGSADLKAPAKVRAEKIAAARERLKEIRLEIARVRGILKKYRGRAVVHRRFKRRIRNYGALIRRLEAERADLRKKVARLRGKSPRAKR